jgi:hypothetical protein
MTRCDNDECPLSKQCTRFLVYPADEDGLQTYKPRITFKNDELLNAAGLTEDELQMMRTECDYFIELAQAPDNYN